MSRWMKLIAFSGFLVFLAACSGSGSPRRIASYPSGGADRSSTSPPAAFVYSAQMEIEVLDPLSASERASRLAEENGGWLVSSQTTRWSRQEQITVVLAVPAYKFEALHAALLRLGKLRHESVSVGWDELEWSAFSEVTVTFLPSAKLPDLPGGWNPGQTLSRAFGVFMTIFGFLADLLIWVVVVLGPFVLIAWGAYRLFRRLRRPSGPGEQSEP